MPREHVRSGCAVALAAALAGVLAGCATRDKADAAPSPGKSVSSRVSSAEPPVAAATDSGGPTDSGADLDWVEDYEAVCVSLVQGMSPEEAVAKLTAGRARAFPTRVAAEDWVADSDDYDRNWIVAGRVGDWTFIWEDNGFQGSLEEVAARMSVRSPFVSVFWNVNAVEAFTYARDGHVVRQFDPYAHDDDAGTGDALPAESGLDWDDAEVSMLRLQAAITGEPIANMSWLGAAGVSYWGFAQ